jgi:hypothetical protein
VAPIGSLVGVIACRHRVQGKGILVGLTSIGISLYAALVVLFLLLSATMVGC